MKAYMKPEVEMVEFVVEEDLTNENTEYGDNPLSNGNSTSPDNPFGDLNW